MVFLVTQKNVDAEMPEIEELYEIGTVAVIKQLIKLPGGVLRVMVSGMNRGRLLSLEQEDHHLQNHHAVILVLPIEQGNIDELGKEKQKVGDKHQSGGVDHDGLVFAEPRKKSLFFGGKGQFFIHFLLVFHRIKESPFRL